MIPYLLGAVAIVAWLVLPGLVIGVLAERRAPTPARARIALFGLTGGLCFWYLGSQILVRLGATSVPVVWLVTVALGVGSVVVLRRFGQEVLARLEWAELFRSIAIGGVATVVCTLPILRLIGSRDDTLLGSTPWYYWRLTQETIRAHGVPRWSWEWALRLPYLDDYPAFTSASAVLAVASGDSANVAAARLMIGVALVTFALSGYLLAARARRGPAPGCDRRGRDDLRRHLQPEAVVVPAGGRGLRPDAAGSGGGDRLPAHPSALEPRARRRGRAHLEPDPRAGVGLRDGRAGRVGRRRDPRWRGLGR